VNEDTEDAVNEDTEDAVNEDTEDAVNEDTEDAVNEDDEETQLNIAEIFVPSSDEEDVPIVQTLRAAVCPPHKHIPKDERAVGQPVAKQFEAGLFVGKVERIEKKRGRCLYNITYDEDGDGEDMDENEYEDACMVSIHKDTKLRRKLSTKRRYRLRNDMQQHGRKCVQQFRQRGDK
jgi:hypothetical protein